jgi:hypothetical protein
MHNESERAFFPALAKIFGNFSPFSRFAAKFRENRRIFGVAASNRRIGAIGSVNE